MASFNSFGAGYNKSHTSDQIIQNEKTIFCTTVDTLLNKRIETKPFEIKGIHLHAVPFTNNSFTLDYSSLNDNEFAQLNSRFVAPSYKIFEPRPMSLTDNQPEDDTVKTELCKRDYAVTIQHAINEYSRCFLLINKKKYTLENVVYSIELETVSGNIIVSTKETSPGDHEIKIQKYQVIDTNRVEFNLSSIQRYRITILKNRIDDTELSSNSVYLDLGIGVFEASLNYALKIRTAEKRDWYLRLGVGGAGFPFFWGGPGGIIGFTMLKKGYSNHHFELNMGAIIGYNVGEEEFFEFPIFGYPLFDIGYRYQKPKTAGLFFKAKIGLGTGIGLGYAFN
jgi:hypothetical protein